MKKVKFTNGTGGKGFAAALVLSICAVGISAYAAYSGAISKLGGEEAQIADDNVFLYGEDTRDVSADKLDVPKETEQTTESADEAGIVFSNPKTCPIAGAEVINPYSGGELVKSETLGVWKTHDGADYAAEVGTAVASMMKGTVKEVNSDPLWGICVVIDHGDEVIGHYCGLDANVCVKAGQQVAMGEIIGQVGNTADIECKLAPHLHFAVTQNGAYTDPVKFIDS